MFRPEADSAAAYERFVRRVVDTRQVWGLHDDEGWCVAPSAELPDDEEDEEDEDEGVSVLPFWSDRAYAQQCAKDEWASYVATPMELDEFMNEWLPAIARHGDPVGTNWTADLVGREVDPDQLLAALRAAGA